MSASDVVRAWEDAFEANDQARLKELSTDDYVDHWPPPDVPSSIDGAIAFRQLIAAGFPDMSQTLDEVIEQGDTVASRWSSTAKHTGEFMGIPATNKKVEVKGISFYKVRDDKVAETWNMVDFAGLMEQLSASG
jgi:steroid delta-isomerase-like uncharacterized protein